MRSLPPELLAAQRSDSAVPYLKVTIADRIGGIRRLAFQRLYTGLEPDGYHAATMPADGSLLRARVDAGRLYYQRVTSPGPLSDFATWTDIGAAASADVALCSEGSNVLLFYVDTNGVDVKLRESSDSGATLGAAITVVTAASAVTWLAADVKSNGDALLLYSVGATVYAVKRSGGSWGSATAWTNSVASVSGLACYHAADYNVAVAGVDASGDALLWTAVYGDGFSQAPDTWSALREVTRASGGSSVTFRAPFLGQPDSFRLTFVEKYTGSQAYSRPYHGYMPATAAYADNLWREPIPFDLASEYGLAVAWSGTAAWLSTPSGVWTASLDDGSTDVTADVLEAVAEERANGGRLRVVLRNDDGRYTDASLLKVSAEVRVSRGYVTANGPQASFGPAYWVDAVEYVSGGGEASVVLYGSDGWALLASWRARRQYAWAAGERNVFGILQFLFARAGLEFSSVGGSSDSANLYPAFTVHPGESGLTAVRRLLALLPDVIYLRGEFAFLKEPLASESVAYSYGVDHALLRGRYVASVAETNRAQVFGDGVFAERLDWPGVEAAYDRLAQVHDLNLTTVAQAEDRGDAVLRKAALTAEDGEIAAPVNCGQELYDVVDVTDAGAGLSAAKRRVLGIELRYSTGAKAAYEQRLGLGGV
ncbi:MAG: hypothetical protein IIA91_07920 [Chloroflexi bacterium]|nr:hypothetical protein [Chloroflexota bacterium]